LQNDRIGLTVMEEDNLQARIDNIFARIDAACARVGRDPLSVQLVAVSKTFPPEVIDEARACGLSLFGENRVQEAVAKSQLCGSAEWHLIGPLQRNKIKHALPLFSCIHSLDNVKLIEQLAQACEESGARPDVLLEVNVAGEASKHGFTPKTVREGVGAAMAGGLRLVGLMTVPPWTPDQEGSRKYFRQLRELRDALEQEYSISLPELSMGMSGDFEVAIEEGATFVRVGTALFGVRKAKKWAPQSTGLTTDEFSRSLDTDDFV
jgi:pyridoxal phosphate enzyme (YggS family)